ncbi:hypothetical protein C8J57DRAFT_1520261 [Mycena rebaudengoi]|nr:hypothetical protein C8J57DRAFT_1520261 [Mycena rebaudengoi]
MQMPLQVPVKCPSSTTCFVDALKVFRRHVSYLVRVLDLELETTGILPILSYNNLLVASWINCMLFMLELVLAVRYFQHSSQPLLHRAGIGAMIASDMLCTSAVYVKIYLLVSVYPNGPPLGFPNFGLQASAVIICSTYATSSLAKLFLIDPFQNEKAGNQCHSCVQHRGAARIFLCISDLDPYNRVAIRLGHANIQNRGYFICGHGVGTSDWAVLFLLL